MSTASPWHAQLPDEVVTGLGALWGKSDAGGRPNLLVQHLLDTGAVAEQIWDHYLAPAFRARLDEATQGAGRRFLAWLCAAHDLGKATPAFQWQDRNLAERVREAGLTWGYQGDRPNRHWRHERASARIVVDAVTEAGWSRRSSSWVWPLLAGHHGLFPDAGDIRRPTNAEWHGTTSAWRVVQTALVDTVTRFIGYVSLAQVEPAASPPRAVQLSLSGFIIMADWIASDERHFPGVDDLGEVSPERARERAERGWKALGLRPGWRRLPEPTPRVIEDRFHVAPRPSQQAVVETAVRMPAPGLLVVEAPTGEGKTEAALAAAEVLSSRFGADGVFIGMPTQATSDPMLTRVERWASALRPGIQVALLHGKRLFNPEWRRLLDRRETPGPAPDDLDEHGLPDAYGSAPRPHGINEGGLAVEDAAAAVEEWLLGRKRGLLAPVAVGTVDQLLFAATRTKHVALRFAGLAGKVVILDEVHAADIYMGQFLQEALWWLGEARIPVILLSATLSPQQREDLMKAYLGGAVGDTAVKLAEENLDTDGYPRVTAAWPEDGRPATTFQTAQAWRPDRPVGLTVLDDDSRDPSAAISSYLGDAMRDGGCVLVLLNTVGRAQATYAALRDAVPGEVVLVHGRLTAADRAERTERLLKLLGPATPGSPPRPERLVVVATQVAEQSFDIDVDLLVSDLAPVDLLLQRIGRLHRHDRDPVDRPAALAAPTVVVTGLSLQPDALPSIARSALAIYGEADQAGNRTATPDRQTPYRAAAPLLRTAALVEEASHGDAWLLPRDVPALVARAYGSLAITPAGWRDAEERELAAFRALQQQRARRANPYRLAPGGTRTKKTLEGIHGRGAQDPAEEEALRAVVRDGPPSVEIVLVKWVGDRYRSLDDVDLGLTGERIHDLADPAIALGGTVRLPTTFPDLIDAAEQLPPVLPEWRDHPWTRRAHVLVLEHGEAELGRYRIRYDRELGLLVEPAQAHTPAKAGTT